MIETLAVHLSGAAGVLFSGYLPALGVLVLNDAAIIPALPTPARVLASLLLAVLVVARSERVPPVRELGRSRRRTAAERAQVLEGMRRAIARRCWGAFHRGMTWQQIVLGLGLPLSNRIALVIQERVLLALGGQ